MRALALSSLMSLILAIPSGALSAEDEVDGGHLVERYTANASTWQSGDFLMRVEVVSDSGSDTTSVGLYQKRVVLHRVMFDHAQHRYLYVHRGEGVVRDHGTKTEKRSAEPVSGFVYCDGRGMKIRRGGTAYPIRDDLKLAFVMERQEFPDLRHLGFWEFGFHPRKKVLEQTVHAFQSGALPAKVYRENRVPTSIVFEARDARVTRTTWKWDAGKSVPTKRTLQQFLKTDDGKAAQTQLELRTTSGS